MNPTYHSPWYYQQFKDALAFGDRFASESDAVTDMGRIRSRSRPIRNYQIRLGPWLILGSDMNHYRRNEIGESCLWLPDFVRSIKHY